MARKMASIKIVSIKPHSNADTLEIAQVDGWQCVVKKGEMKTGDLIVYFEIDALLPKEDERFAFLEGKKIRTIMLRGEISQGLAMPLSLFPELKEYKENDDVSSILKVEKWEPQIPSNLEGNIVCPFPISSIITDEIRIQTNPAEIIKEFSDEEIYISTKCDGTSSSFINIEGTYHVCSRTNSMAEDYDNTYWQISKKYNLKEKLMSVGNFAIQGETCGEKIQKNRLNLKGNELFVFNVYNIDKRRYLDFDDFINFCKDLQLQTVPIIYRGKLPFTTFDEGMLYAEGKYPGTDNYREGIVIRPTKERYSPILKGRASFKIVSNKYLLKGGE